MGSKLIMSIDLWAAVSKSTIQMLTPHVDAANPSLEGD
jgi:hypothetical protein